LGTPINRCVGTKLFRVVPPPPQPDEEDCDQ